MLEPCTNLESSIPEQHLDFHFNGQIKILGNSPSLGSHSFRKTNKAYIQHKQSRTMTLTEGEYQKNWVNIFTSPDTSASIIVDKLQLMKPQTLTVGVGSLRRIATAGAIAFSVGIHRTLLDSDLRFSILEIGFPDKQRTIKISDHLRYNIINRISLLLSSEMNQKEFHMEAVDLVTTVLSTTFLKPNLESKTSRVRLLHRALEVVAVQDPKLLTPAFVADQSFASIRTLEYAFKDMLYITPKQYIDYYRINLLREKIIASPHIPITHIGMEIGLPHLGNLSRNYKALYGETPSATKRRLAGL
ncbi:MAG: AraC family transcriptional regulator [Pseudomonadales bacterium]|nr:AraC family transcriptional regulator [Pseudomonadales bacterium]